MKNLKNLSKNELMEIYNSISESIYLIEKRYSHISIHLDEELNVLKKKGNQVEKELSEMDI